MTVAKEEPGILVAVCDRCHERHEFDIDPDHEAYTTAELLEEIGWLRCKPEADTQSDGHFSTTKVIYYRDLCGDCQDGNASPKPKFGRVAPSRRQHVDVDDPCDEWPRALIFAAVGLLPACGHPHNPDPKCSWCLAGYPIGTTRIGWRR